MDYGGFTSFDYRGIPSSKNWLCNRICCKPDKVWEFPVRWSDCDCAGKNSRDKIRAGFFDRLLISIGDCSYGIFYVHMFVLMMVQKLISMAELSEVWIVNFVLCFALTAVGSYLIVWGVKKLVEKQKRRKILRILGF